MTKKTSLEKIEKIQQMRARGKSLAEIGRALDIAPSTAHTHSVTPLQARHATGICGAFHHDRKSKCKRHAGHRGVHLNDDDGLVYW